MKDKLIDILNESFEKQYDKNLVISAYCTAKDLIANGVTFAEDNNVRCKWIPVSERLPEPFVSALVQMPGEEPCPTVREGYLTNKGTWHAALFEREQSEVTHWMPMPEFHGKEERNVT